MTKIFNKWLRKLHRWLSIPMIVLVPIAIAFKLMGSDPSVAFPPQLEKLQSILLLTLAITGAYLYLLPYIAKWQRQQRQRAKVRAESLVQPNKILTQPSQE